MISVTKLLFNDEYFGDSLRYSNASKGAVNGTTSESGPVVVWNSTRTCNLRCAHCYMEELDNIFDFIEDMKIDRVCFYHLGACL